MGLAESCGMVFINACTNQRRYERADPIYPVIPLKASVNDAWPKAPCWIETSTRKVYTRKHGGK
jgi:hypothetical protein